MTYTEPPTDTFRPVRPPRRGSHVALRVVTVVAVLVAVAAVLLALGVLPNPLRHHAKPAGAATFTMSGAITIEGTPTVEFAVNDDESCEGIDGFSDLGRGVAVVIGDARGHTVATGSLDPGVASLTSCELPWHVSGVPANLSEYTVTISHRGTQVVPGGEATQPLELTIGG